MDPNIDLEVLVLGGLLKTFDEGAGGSGLSETDRFRGIGGDVVSGFGEEKSLE